ncbi:AraC family transcriptional regulator [Fulvivirga ligni]|uniref:AraC family transcriptional regulator n=1 Tax=Fulvivirga ligni TaxID=2904246 RepID=UPI001F217A6C|nr:AraC family transcriptional regulator [Fulvivirga ligni]UII24271.1 AraC family transcriptional regulator [Fulvivirga ligni]
MKPQIHIDKDFGWFIGQFDNNQKHRHYALQLSIPIDGSICIKSSGISLETASPVLIKPNVVHQITSNSSHFLLLVNPASTVGHFWNQISLNEMEEIQNPVSEHLKEVLRDKKPSLEDHLNKIINENDCWCDAVVHRGDERINKALSYLSHHFDRVVSLEEIAHYCHLSSGRFLHLFKEETGITYRRLQLWNKLTKAFPQLTKKSLTEIAHHNGFADSAHLSRAFKENFGFTPREFIKISQFIQV